MSRVITYQMCGMVLDALYHNARKDPKDQKSIVQIAQDCNISRGTVHALRDILINLKILIKEGTSRGQRIYWHPDKCGLSRSPRSIQRHGEPSFCTIYNRIKNLCKRLSFKFAVCKRIVCGNFWK